jgi:hypothetical protein
MITETLAESAGLTGVKAFTRMKCRRSRRPADEIAGGIGNRQAERDGGKTRQGFVGTEICGPLGASISMGGEVFLPRGVESPLSGIAA